MSIGGAAFTPDLAAADLTSAVLLPWSVTIIVAKALILTPRFFRNVAISLPMFLVDLGLLYVLVRRAHVEYLTATAVSFLRQPNELLPGPTAGIC
jgi:hypothetical protein